MNWREGVALALAVGITAGGAWVLAQRQARQRLGVPGVRVVAEPVFGEDKHVVGSNSVWLPDRVLDYQSKVVPINKIVEEWLPRDTVYGHRHYTAGDGFEVDQSVVLMGADRTSIHQPQYCLVGSGWRIEKQELTTIRIEQPYPYDLPVCKLTLLANVKGPSGRAEAVHRAMVKEVLDMRGRYLANPASVPASETLDFLSKWLMRHIIGKDLRYRPYAEGHPAI